MGEKEISIDVSELGRLEVSCPKCHGGYVLSFDPADNSRLPSMCPCNQEIGDLAQAAVNNYRKFFADATRSKMPFRFRVKVS